MSFRDKLIGPFCIGLLSILLILPLLFKPLTPDDFAMNLLISLMYASVFAWASLFLGMEF